MVIPAKDAVVQKSSSNLVNAKTIIANYVNLHDLQKYKKVLFFKDAIAAMEKTFLNGGKEEVVKAKAKKEVAEVTEAK
mgnify:FL=1